MKRTITYIFIIALTFSLGCAKKEDLVVAEVGGRQITVADFERASEIIEEEYLPLTDDLEGKKQLLDHMINKEVMALRAIESGYEKEEMFLGYWNRFRPPFLITAMMDQYIRKKVTVTEEEVDDYYEKMHYEYTLSQIVVADESFAWELREKIMAGEDFAEMAKKHSIDQSAEDGGFLGSSPVGAMIPWVEEALFGMKEGDISEPLRTHVGWSLIKVHRIRRIEPEKGKEYVRDRVFAIKEKLGIEKMKAEIEKEIEMTFYTDAVQIAYDALPEDIPPGDIYTYKVTRANAPNVEIPEQYEDMIIVQYVDGAYTLRDFAEYYEALGLPERPTRRAGKEAIITAMHKKVFDVVLPVYAEHKLKILEIPEVRETLERKKEEFLVYLLYQDQVRDEITVTPGMIEEYYHTNIDEIRTAEKREFSIIVVSDLATAQEVATRARSGEDFSKLAIKYSEDPTVKENLGKTGLMEKGHYPEYDGVAFSLPEEGSVSDPFRVSRGWVVVKIEQIKGSSTPTLPEARSTIQKSLMEEKADKILMEKLEKWREGYPITIYDNNLGKAELKRTRL